MKNIYLQSEFSRSLDTIYQTSHHTIPITVNNKTHRLAVFEKNKDLLVGVLFEKTGLADEIDKDITSIIPQIIEYAENNGFDSLRVFSKQGVEGLSNHMPDKVNMVVELPDNADVVWKSIKSTMRNRVRRPNKEGYHYTIRSDAADLEIFYSIYFSSIHNIGSLTLPFSFFKDIFHAFQDSINIYIGYINDKPVCGAFLTDCGDEIFMPWVGSIKEYNRFGVNMAMYWHMIEWSIAQGKSRLNLGRSTRNEGTYKFKKQWLAGEQQLFLYHIPIFQESDIKNKIYSHISKSIKKSPDFVMDYASKLFVRRFY